MPNNVTNRLLFNTANAERILAECANSDGVFDFNTLIPKPHALYQGPMDGDDEKDFPLNWFNWSRENWGTKWNSYNGKRGVAPDGRVFVQFDTAWSVPYPVLVALANKYHAAFEHRYFDEGESFWGVETWGVDVFGIPVRLTKRKNAEEDKETLCMELKNYSLDSNGKIAMEGA